MYVEAELPPIFQRLSSIGAGAAALSISAAYDLLRHRDRVFRIFIRTLSCTGAFSRLTRGRRSTTTWNAQLRVLDPNVAETRRSCVYLSTILCETNFDEHDFRNTILAALFNIWNYTREIEILCMTTRGLFDRSPISTMTIVISKLLAQEYWTFLRSEPPFSRISVLSGILWNIFD